MKLFNFLAVVSTTLGLVVAAPTPSVEVELYSGTSSLEERSHCYNHPNENPECRQGCGWYSFDSSVGSNTLVMTPPSDPLLCELFNGRLFRISMGKTCHCDIWLRDNCQGNSLYQLDDEIDSQDMHGFAYRCYRKN